MMSVYRLLFKDRSLWFKFSLVTVLPILLVATFLLLNVFQSMEKSLKRKTRDAALELTELAGLSMSNPSFIYNKNLLDNFVDSLSRDRDIVFAMVIDESDSRILAHSDHSNDGMLYNRSASLQGGKDIDLIASPITIHDKKYGEIVVAYSLKGVIQEVKSFRDRLLTVAGLAIILGFALAVFLSRFISRPVRLIARQAREIGAGDFEQKIVHESRDALGDLAASVNEMAFNLRDRETQLETINNISERLYYSFNRETVIRQAVDILAEYTGAPSVVVFLLDRETGNLHLVEQRGFDEETLKAGSVLPLEGSLTGLAIKNKEVIDSQDISEDRRLEKTVQGALIKSGHTGGVVSIPLLYMDQTLGALNLIYKKKHELDRRQRATLKSIGRTLGLALSNADYVTRIEDEIKERMKVEESLRHTVREMTTLNTLARRTVRHLSVDQVVKTTIECIKAPLFPDAVMIFLREGELLILKDYQADSLLHRQEIIVAGDCLCGTSLKRKAPVYSTDISVDPICTRDECKLAGLRSFAALPLISGDRILGVLGLGSREPRQFADEAAFLETLAGQVAVALMNAELFEQIRKQAAELEERVAERTAELEVAMERAWDADRIKSAFLASMSHELRTPLNSIIGFTGIILQELAGPLNEEQAKQMGMVQNSARHLLDLINDVLDISKIEAGQLELAVDSFQLDDAVNRVLELIGPMAERKALTLETDIETDIGIMVSDRRRVEQILINLVNNAVKFTERGRIRIQVHRRADKIVASVADSGIGIEPEDLKKLFQPFRQVDSGLARRYEGTGLGLSICKKLVDMLGGEIWAQSDGEGKGSIFTFTLPIYPGEFNET